MRNFFKQLKKDERGLTLVELLAVVVILAIVGAIAVVAIGNVIDNSRKDAHISNAMQVLSAAKLAEASGTEIEGTNGTASSNPANHNLDTIDTLTDPWESDGDYEITVTKTGEVYTINASGAECNINNVDEETLLENDRDVLCND